MAPNPARAGQIEYRVVYAMNVDGAIWAGSGTYLIRN